MQIILYIIDIVGLY